jgi:hypothetical protein
MPRAERSDREIGARVAAYDREIGARVAAYDWRAVAGSLDECGYARLPGLLDARECASIVGMYAQRERFRSFVDMSRLRFGVGDYRYFAAPLPPLVRALRESLYAPLAAIANGWLERLGKEERFPTRLRGLLARCHEAGQHKPTPLLLHYEAGGYNRLHQDIYGPLVFPLQVTCLLSSPAKAFRGGEILLVEQRARMQSRGDAVALALGEAVVFPCRERPVRGATREQRAIVRHGVSRIHSGERFTLGIIFHDAK